MKTNLKGIEIIKESETSDGLPILNAYLCPSDVPTIGWGSTKNVKLPMSISVKEAEERLEADILEAEKVVTKYVKVPLNENQFSALVSFVFNVGSKNFKNSTLLKLINIHNFEQASLEFSKWKFGNGKVLNGLVIRREKERKLFEEKLHE